MAGRERKSSVKNLGVKKEADTCKQSTSQSEANIIADGNSPKKEQKKCTSTERKSGLRKKATGGVNDRKAPNKADTKTKGTNAVGKKLTSSDTQAKNPKNAKLIQDQKPNNVASSEPPANQQNVKRTKLSKTIKTETHTTEAPESKTESSASNTLKKPQIPKVRKLSRLNKLGIGVIDARTGTRNRNAPYVTRSDSPARVLRNGKRRKLKDPSLLEGLDVRCPKRRRLLSSTKDVSASDVVIKSEVLDDQASVAGSDISYDSHVENGKTNWDLVRDVKSSVEGNTVLEKKKLKHAEDPAQVTDNCLGKAISNKIAELISRNKFLETLGKDLAPKAEETIFKPLAIKTEDIPTHDSFVKKDLKVSDKSTDVAEKETATIEKGRNINEQHHAKSNLSQNNAEKKISEIAQNFPSLATVKKEQPDHLELQLKNGQNRSYRLSSRSLSEKAKKIRDFKLGRSKTTKLYQSCPSSSGMFYVVEDPADIASRQVVSSSSGECSSSNSNGTSQEANSSGCNIKSEKTEMSDQGKATIGMEPSTSVSPIQKGIVESRENADKTLNKAEEENVTTAEGPDSTISDMNIKSVMMCEKETSNCDNTSSELAVISPVKKEVISNSSEEKCTTKVDILESSHEAKENLHGPCSSVESTLPACETRCVKEELKVTTENDEERIENTHLQDLERLEDKLSELVQAATSLEPVKMIEAVLEEPSKVNDTDESKCLKTIDDCNKSMDLCLELVPKEEIKSLVEDSSREQNSEVANAQDAKPAECESTMLELAEVDSTIQEPPKSNSVMTLQEACPGSCVEEPFKNSTSEVASKLNCTEEVIAASEEKELEAFVSVEATKVNSSAIEKSKTDVIPTENDCHEMIQQELKSCDNMQVETTKPEINTTGSLKNEVESCIEGIVECQTDNLVSNIGTIVKEQPIDALNPIQDVKEVNIPAMAFESPKELSEFSLENSRESLTLTAEETKLLEVIKSPERCSEESQRNDRQNCKHISSESETQIVEVDGADRELQKCEMSSPVKEMNDNEKSLEMSLERQESMNDTTNIEEREMDVLHAASADACQVTDVKKNEIEEVDKDISEAVSNFVELANVEDDTENILLVASENLKATADGSEAVEEAGISEKKEVAEEVSPEELAVKESVLSALGLQPLRSLQTSNAVNSHEKPCDNYTGTLKTVIKLSRSSPEKRHRSSVKFVVKQGKSQNTEETTISGGKGDEDSDESDYDGDEKIEYSISHESGTIDGNSFAAGSRKNVKSSYSYRSYFDISSQPHLLPEKNVTSDTLSTEAAVKDEGKNPSAKQSDNLIIPEKSSSFSIHPERLCSDVCSYCFGKFGSLDTPCHIAQLKSAERQQKILEAETHLTADSCLCDACYRHVDRKANCPSYKPNKKRQHHRSSSTQMKSICCVQGCSQPAHHHVRRKWLVKLKRSIAKKAPIDLDKMPQHLPFPLCSQHYYWIEFFMVCGICKRRLTRNHMYPLGPEVRELNAALIHDGIPVRLSEKLFLCKLCRYFASLRMKHKNPSQLSGNHKMFFQSYRKRILHYHDIEEMDDDEATEDAGSSTKTKRRKTRNPSAMKEDDDDTSGGKSKSSSPSELDDQHSNANVPSHDFSSALDYLGESVLERSGATTPMIDYSSLGSVDDSGAETMSSRMTSQKKLDRMKLPKIKLKLGKRSVEKIGSLSVSHDERGSTRSIVIPDRDGLEVTPVFEDLSRTSYSEQEELNLHAEFDFQSRKQDHSPSRGRGEWEKCNATIQFDKETKSMFQELRRPYGNYSSFFRHLVLLEKHWRAGDLALSSRASSRAVTYLNSVQNRIRAYEGHPTLSPGVKSLQSTSAIPATPQSSNVPIIDLPLKGNLGGGILNAAEGSLKPVTITSVSISQHSGSLTSVSSQPPTSVFTFPQGSTSSPVPRSVPLTSRSPGQQNKRIPNILQVTAGGKSFSIMPGFSQLRQFRSLQPRKLQPKPSVQTTNTHVQPTQRTSPNSFEPMICDVRSLATETSGLWDRSSVEITPHNGTSNSQSLSQPQQPSISVSILPNTITAVQHVPNVSPKPSTIVTPTGIILSRKPDLSVTTIMETKDSALKPKSAVGRKDDVQKKIVSEKTEAARTAPVLEISDSALTLTVPEKKNILPKAKC